MSTPATRDLTRGRLVEPGEDVHERGLAGARRAHDRGQAAFGDVDRHAAQGVDGGVALAVAADDAAGGDDGGGDGGLSGRSGPRGSAWELLLSWEGGTSPSQRGRSARQGASRHPGVPEPAPRALAACTYSSTARMRRLSSSPAASPNLPKIAVTCFCTARSLTARRSPMPLFERPSATSCSTSCSRGVSACSGPASRLLCQQPRDDLGVEGRAAGDHAPQRADELRDVADAVLEQVAEALRALGEHARGGAQVDVLGEDHDRRSGVARAQLLRGAHALVGEVGRHPDVDDRDVGAVLVDVAQQLLGAGACATTSIPAPRSSATMPARTSRLSSAITTRTAAPR